MKGGYMMIDCMGLSVDSTVAVIVAGLGGKLGTALRRNKPIMLYNLRRSNGMGGTTPLSPVGAACSLSATMPDYAIYTMSIPGFGLDSTIHLTVSGDTVSINKTGTDEDT